VYERLVRKIMQKPHKPAVVMLQLMPKGMAFGPGNREKAPFPATLEDMYGALAQYYDAPWLSFRNAAWRLGEFHQLSFDVIARGRSLKEKKKRRSAHLARSTPEKKTNSYGYNWTDLMWTADFLHPVDHGMRAIADLAVNLLQTTAMGLVIDPLGPVDRELLAEPLPPPAHPGNWEARNLMCVYGEAFAENVDLPASKGFELVNEGGNARKPKWGFVATRPGSELIVRMNTTRTTHARDGDQRMNVMLAYLKSYEHMGVARTPSSRCVVQLEVLPESKSGEHKFKLMQAVVSTLRDVSEELAALAAQ